MQRKYVINLDEYDQRLLIRALNDLRTSLLEEERSTGVCVSGLGKSFTGKNKSRILCCPQMQT